MLNFTSVSWLCVSNKINVKMDRKWRRQKIKGGFLTILVISAIVFNSVHAQDISPCCSKATGTCRNVCEKMSLLDTTTSSTSREEKIQNIYKFCTPHLIEFWICMNQTIQEVVTGSSWWGRACCSLVRGAACRQACVSANDVKTLSHDCRRSDEIAFFDCVEKQQEAQWCCSQTQSLSCHEACEKVLWRIGQFYVDLSAKDRAYEMCEHSAPLLQCMRELTASTVHTDTDKYLSCCHESSNAECRSRCATVLRESRTSQEIATELSQWCGSPAIHGAMWQCFLRRDAEQDNTDIIPYDAVKLHCCQKATTINCRRLCFDTYNSAWHDNWQKFYAGCLGDPQESSLNQCIEEVEAPCSLGCAGLTYCSQLNNRPTTMFRSCSAQADLDAHLAVAHQRDSGFVNILGMQLPLRNSSQCSAEMWKAVACALHVKPCTSKGSTSAICEDECVRVVSSCVEWGAVSGAVSARAVCARLAPKDKTEPCVPLTNYFKHSISRPLLSVQESITSPCAGAVCNSTQVCQINRNCLQGARCHKYTCLDGCPLGENSATVVPIDSWVRIPMSASGQKWCFKICKCGSRGTFHCQPLPCVNMDFCRMHDHQVAHGSKFFLECNPCVCVWGGRECGRRACVSPGAPPALLSALPCNCPPHHLPVYTPSAAYPNACLAKCTGATDAEIEFVNRDPCSSASCPLRHECLYAPNVCLSRLQTSCPQYVCVNTTSCSSQPYNPVCDIHGKTFNNPCFMMVSGRRLAYWGPCLKGCSTSGQVCGVNGVTYMSECAAWSEYVSVDYFGPCVAVGAISDKMELKCKIDRVICPPLKNPKCKGFTAPGACCPRCGGAIRILYSKKQIDRALYGTNVSATVINLKNMLNALERHVKIAECALRGYLTIEMEIFVTIESLLQDPTDLQLDICVLEAVKIADLINRESALISIDLGLSSLSYALIVHTEPSRAAHISKLSLLVFMLLFLVVYMIK